MSERNSYYQLTGQPYQGLAPKFLPGERELPEEESPEIKKRRITGTLSQTLVSSMGADFCFSDRDASFEILASSLEQRYYCVQVGLTDKMFHRLPFLAAGRGSGKSRFLQELPKSFASYIKNLKQSVYERSECPEKVLNYIKNTPTSFDDFKSTFSTALFINISFGSGALYTGDEAELGIEKSLCLRMLYPYYAHKYYSFVSFYGAYIDKRISLPRLTLETTIRTIGKDKCIVLGIDELDVLHSESEYQFKSLFLLVGSFSSVYSPLFVAVLAGNVIGEMKQNAKYPPLNIPLPLLSFDSCLRILVAKDQKYENQVKTNLSLRKLVSDIGGHCLALEILYRVLSKYPNESYLDHWDDIIRDVQRSLSEMDRSTGLPFYGKAFAYSFLSLRVGKTELVSKSESKLTFLDLEESGLLKLKKFGKFRQWFRVEIPMIFIMCFLQSSSLYNEYSQFWSHLLISEKFYWKSWKEFNCQYIAFRLSLFSKLGMTTISLTKFLSGANMNIPEDLEIMDIREDIEIKIPSLDCIKNTKCDFQYSTTNQKDWPIGTCVVTAPGSPFDALFYLETTAGEKLLFALQMMQRSVPQKITNNTINDEFEKVNSWIDKNFPPKTNFFLLVLGDCEGVYDAKELPSKCAVVTEREFEGFYGEKLTQYLKLRVSSERVENVMENGAKKN